MPKTKILYLAVYYAPYNIVTTFRNLKISKYLDLYNFEQYIFTGYYTRNINKRLNDDIPKSAKIFRKKINFPEIEALSACNVNSKLFSKLKFLIKDLLFSPDKFIWWILFYLPQMILTIKKEKIKIVMVGGWPYSSFVGALLLKKLCKIKLVLDFHDPWKNMPINLKQSFIRRFWDWFWEKLCVQNADLITVCTDNILNELYHSYKPKAKIIKVSNGFDYDDFRGILKKKEKKTDRFTFLYTGKYYLKYDDYNPSSLVKAFDAFVKKYDIHNCDLIMIGLTDESTKQFIEKLNNPYIKCRDLMPKHEVLQLQNNSDVLIHFYYPKTHKDTISLKICEYALCKKPIISFNVEEGELYNFLKENELGETASSHNIDEMVSLFHKAYSLEIKICDDPVEKLQEYNYQSIIANLSKYLNDLV